MGSLFRNYDLTKLIKIPIDVQDPPGALEKNHKNNIFVKLEHEQQIQDTIAEP